VVVASASFDVERYLLHAGAKFADRMAPSRLLALSLSADLHRVQPERVVVPTTVVAAQGDVLIPATQTDELARRLPRLASHVTLDTLTGHDAFLVETRQVSLILTTALAH
jgi:homoserine O-acetyltransferase